MVKTKNYFMYRFLLIFIILMFCFLPNSPIVSLTVVADGYTNVLEDLKKDESFKESDYVLNENDFSIQVIQIAETTDKELLIYTYQPSGKVKDFKASYINVLTDMQDTTKRKVYTLNFLNSEGVFYKYLVDDFLIGDDIQRHYDISSISRPWDEKVDEKPEGDNVINDVAYNVGKIFTAVTEDGKVSYQCVTSETIEIKEKYNGFLRYQRGAFFPTYVDSHFVAFSTDKPIEKLMEADVKYVSKKFRESITSGGIGTPDFAAIAYDDPILKYSYLKSTNAEISINGWFGRIYTWSEIQSKDEFLNTEKDLTPETKLALQDKDWILRFVETDYTTTSSGVTRINEGTVVEKVTVLRLKFETQGIVYDLGVVDNTQSGGLTPGNARESWLKKILILIAIIGLVVLILIIFGPSIFIVFFNILFKVLSYILKGVWWLITAPFSVFDDE